MYQKWSFEETLMLTDFVAAHHGLPWSGSAPANPQDRFIELRDRLFPGRTADSVYMQAWDIASTMGFCAEHGQRPSTQIRYVAALYQEDPAGMSTLASDIEALRQIRARSAAAAAAA